MRKKHNSTYIILTSIIVSFLLSGCSEQQNTTEDLELFMKEARSELDKAEEEKIYHQQEVKNLSTYTAKSMRSPFQLFTGNSIEESINTNVKPDPSRALHFLETIDLESVIMVGTMTKDNNLWAVVKTPKGIFRVKKGEHMGKNHGQIVRVDKDQMRLIEIVASGPTSWVERPRIIKLHKDKNNNKNK